MGDQPANTQLKYIKTYHYVKKIEQNKAKKPGKSAFLKEKKQQQKRQQFLWWWLLAVKNAACKNLDFIFFQ